MKTSNKKGQLTIIAGPMFSGKTGKLVAMVDVFRRMGFSVLTVKPKLDTRYTKKNELYSHDHRKTEAIVVDGEAPESIIARITHLNPDKVIFDEIQFFDKNKIESVIIRLLSIGIDIIAAGLLYDYKRKPFGATQELMGLADQRLELVAVCQKCGNFARHTERVGGGTAQVDIGALDKYIAVCETCHRIFQG